MIKSWKCLICVFIFSCKKKKKKYFQGLEQCLILTRDKLLLRVATTKQSSASTTAAWRWQRWWRVWRGRWSFCVWPVWRISCRRMSDPHWSCSGTLASRSGKNVWKMMSKKSSLKLNSGLIFLRFGCWRETNWRRRRASPKAPIWSPGARTSTSSNRYALLCFDSSSRCYDTTWIIVLCGPWAGLQQRRGSSGAQRLQKETRLRSGHLWRLLRGATEQIRTPQQNRTEQIRTQHLVTSVCAADDAERQKPRPAAVNIRKWQNATGNK